MFNKTIEPVNGNNTLTGYKVTKKERRSHRKKVSASPLNACMRFLHRFHNANRRHVHDILHLAAFLKDMDGFFHAK